ncbi:hypothetical protein V0288_02790 [Pannus brasiliensis CCIBt3594]|uniref:Ribbon-helix-helix protein CopG domain-containing protein n=1 Tax=Pannus brasiliensis CCIBt3594 TaxID=1427578 RepID=A0AAW9QE53_9CHRO
MSITIVLSLEIEARLRERARQQGQDIGEVVSELLTRQLEWESQDSEEAIAGIQKGLDDFESGNSRSFAEFAEESRTLHETG